MKKYYEIAAKWWTDLLRGESALEASEETLINFESNLAKEIKCTVEKQGFMSLFVEIKPDYTLERIAQESGISVGAFPMRTTMGIKVVKAIAEITVKIGNSEKKPLKPLSE